MSTPESTPESTLQGMFNNFWHSDNFAQVRPLLNDPNETAQRRAVMTVFMAGAAGVSVLAKLHAPQQREEQPYLHQAAEGDFHARLVSHARLLEVGTLADYARYLCNGADAVAWRELATMDGMLALAVLPPEDLESIRAELVEQGLKIPVNSPKAIIHVVFAAASQYGPEGLWQDPRLTSTVACSLLLKLAQQAWGKKRIIVAPGVIAS